MLTILQRSVGKVWAILFCCGYLWAEKILVETLRRAARINDTSKDEPETTAPAAAETEPTEPAMTAVDEMVRSEMEKYRYSIDDLNKL